MGAHYSLGELGAALFQALVTLALTLLLLHLHYRHRKPHFLWWGVALGAKTLSVAAIITFMVTRVFALLWLHQVLLAWTALGFLHAANVFSRHVPWRKRYLWLLAVPAAWAYFAIYVLDHFMLAAGPAVLFLALATLWAGVVFLRYRGRTGSPTAGFLALVLMLWAAHHLDYPVLRAQGAWNPWGYYVDILFVLAMGVGILLLVIEEQQEGLLTLTALSGSQYAAGPDAVHTALLEGPLGLRGVRGTALLRAVGDNVEMVRGVGDCSLWQESGVPRTVCRLALDALSAGRSRLQGGVRGSLFAAVLPLGSASSRPMTLAIVGDVAAPFAALDDNILGVVGEQVGSALERAELTRKLAIRTRDLERLSVRMLREHEDQRRRLGRELHDETAQVFSAIKMQLGLLKEDSPDELQERFDRLVEWVDRGSQSIRNATDGLRPEVLDDLGLVPALRTLVGDFAEWSAIAIDFDIGGWPADGRRLLTPDAEVTLFRTLQEALSNVARHAHASGVAVSLALSDGCALLSVADDGIGLEPEELARLGSMAGRSGILGMQERIAAAGGILELATAPAGGLAVHARIPIVRDAAVVAS